MKEQIQNEEKPIKIKHSIKKRKKERSKKKAKREKTQHQIIEKKK